jgi:methionine synthase II (cobalamin-independent)
VFSTLLGRLPPADDQPDVLVALAETGLELLATGAAPAGGDEDPSAVVAGWQAAATATDRPVKQVVAGPYSAGRSGAMGRPAELAERLAETVRALADAGCPFVEVDESDALAIALVGGERRRFVDAHRRLLDGLSGAAPIHLSLALTGGNFDEAGPGTFFDLGYASYAYDLIAGPDNWRLIAAAPGDRGIVCGALDPRPEGDETRELLIWAAQYAASTRGRGPERVGLANAPSLADVPWPVTLRKLTRIAEAVRMGSIEAPEEMGRLLDPRAFGGRRNRPGRPRLARPTDE